MKKLYSHHFKCRDYVDFKKSESYPFNNVKNYYNKNTILPMQILFFLLFLTTFSALKSQTTLNTGDILVTSFDATKTVADDKFSFVTLQELKPNTIIYFTDRGYFGNNSWQAANGGTEGSIMWNLGSDTVPAGSEVVIQSLSVKVNTVAKGTLSSVSGSNPSGLSIAHPSGDQIIIFQGGAGDPSSATAKMIGGLHWNYCPNGYYSVFTTDSGWDNIGSGSSCSTGPNSSNMPPGLDSNSAFWIGFYKPTAPQQDIQNYTRGQFNGSGAPFSSLAALKAAILNKNNWIAVKSSDTSTTISVPTNFTYISSCTPPSITTQPSNKTICNLGTATFTASANNATGFQWQVNEGSGFNNISNGGVYSGATTTTLTITGASSLMNGYQYRMIATGSCSPTASSNSATLTVTKINTLVSSTSVSCFGGSNGTATVVATGGNTPYSYSWAPYGGTAATATGLAAGTYSVTVTDAGGCTATATATVSQPSSAISGTTVITNIACSGNSTGAINLTPAGGTAPYTFNWGGGITTEDRTGLAAGTYTVIITDANGCTATVNATVTQPTTVVSGTTVVTNISCNGGSNGAINLTPAGGTAPYTFNWGGGITTEDRTGLAAGTYTVIITDANGCTATLNATVGQPATAVSGTTVIFNTSCFGGSNGAINLTPAGGTAPYTFNWGGGITTEDRTGLPAGTYTVIITDANGCTATVNATVGQPASAVSGTTVIFNTSCFGGSNGAINLTPAGGTAPYTFNWAGGITTEDRTGLAAGTYTVIITDAKGCTATVNATVTQPATAVSGTTVVTNISCNGGSNGAINLTPAGGTAPYTFNWAGGITTEDRTGLAVGTYTVIITDANGCTATVNATVTQPAIVNAPTGNAVQSFTAGSNLGSLVVNGQNIKWYASASDASNHFNSLPITTIIVNSTTYYATQTIGVCESTASLQVLAYNESLAVDNDIKSKSEVQIYPNPVREVLNISGYEPILKILIIAADGKKVIEKTMQKNDRSIGVHSLVQGNYLIKVFTKSNIQTFKFIKK